MKNKKDIGLVFKEQLQEYTLSPDNQVWDKIVAELPQQKNKKNRILLWVLLGSSALLFSLFIFKNFFQQGTTTTFISLENSNVPSTTNQQINNVITNTDTLLLIKSEILDSSSIQYSNIATIQKKKTSIQNNVTQKTAFNHSKNIILLPQTRNISNITSIKPIDSILFTSINLKTIEVIKPLEIIIDTIPTPTKKQSKWSIYLQSNLTHNNILNTDSNLDTRLNTYHIKNQTSFNYGLYLNYNASSRITFRIGIHRLLTTKTYNDIDLSSITISSLSNATLQNNALLNNNSTIDLNQEITYLEIPLEVKYTFINKRFKASLIGGFSYLTLKENELKILNNENLSITGTQNNLTKKSMLFNLGLGLQTKLFHRFYFNFDPILKLNTKPTNNTNTNNYLLQL